MPDLDVSPVGHELLDDPAADPGVVALSLGNIARANRWLGGAAAVRFGLDRLVGRTAPGTQLTLLDLGTGHGDLPRMARAWASARRLRLDTVGCDRSRVAAGLARTQGVACAVACVGALPFAPRSVDLVLVSQVAHHLAANAIIDLLRAADRMARRGVIVSDLARSGVAALGFRLAARALHFDPATTADGVTSVHRGFRAQELEALLHAAGIEARVHRRPGYRLVAAWHPRPA